MAACDIPAKHRSPRRAVPVLSASKIAHTSPRGDQRNAGKGELFRSRLPAHSRARNDLAPLRLPIILTPSHPHAYQHSPSTTPHHSKHLQAPPLSTGMWPLVYNSPSQAILDTIPIMRRRFAVTILSPAYVCSRFARRARCTLAASPSPPTPTRRPRPMGGLGLRRGGGRRLGAGDPFRSLPCDVRGKRSDNSEAAQRT